MTRRSALTLSDFSQRIAGNGIGFRVGPFNARIRCSVEGLHEHLFRFYRAYPGIDLSSVFSFSINLIPVTKPPRFKRKVRLTVDGRRAHADMPIAHALPVLEWGINLVIAVRSHCFLMLHSAVIERNGAALLLPAAPGFGKSTLCAGLSHRGWRTFSDEFALIRPGTQHMIPVPRPMALKNESIEVIRAFAPDAYVGPVSRGTRKGDVAHLKPTIDSIERQNETAPVSLIVFPRWAPNAELSLQRISPAEGFMLLATNAFNYDLLGESAFCTVRDLVGSADCYRLTYSDLEEATAALSRLSDEQTR